jgi:hypothetical protein
MSVQDQIASVLREALPDINEDISWYAYASNEVRKRYLEIIARTLAARLVEKLPGLTIATYPRKVYNADNECPDESSFERIDEP